MSPFTNHGATYDSGGKEIPLRGLFEAVMAEGGYEQASETKKWAKIVRRLEHDPAVYTNLAWGMKHTYRKCLLPWEQFTRGVAFTTEQGEEGGKDEEAASDT